MVSSAVWPTSSSGWAPDPTGPDRSENHALAASWTFSRPALTHTHTHTPGEPEEGCCSEPDRLAEPQLRRSGLGASARIRRTIWSPPSGGSSCHQIGAAGAAVNAQSRPPQGAAQAPTSSGRHASGMPADALLVIASVLLAHLTLRGIDQPASCRGASTRIQPTNPATPEPSRPAVSDCGGSQGRSRSPGGHRRSTWLWCYHPRRRRWACWSMASQSGRSFQAGSAIGCHSPARLVSTRSRSASST